MPHISIDFSSSSEPARRLTLFLLPILSVSDGNRTVFAYIHGYSIPCFIIRSLRYYIHPQNTGLNEVEVKSIEFLTVTVYQVQGRASTELCCKRRLLDTSLLLIIGSSCCRRAELFAITEQTAWHAHHCLLANSCVTLFLLIRGCGLIHKRGFDVILHPRAIVQPWREREIIVNDTLSSDTSYRRQHCPD